MPFSQTFSAPSLEGAVVVIVPYGPNKQMARIVARRVVAFMTNRQSICDTSVDKYVCHPVNPSLFFLFSFCWDVERAVAKRVSAKRPAHTLVGVHALDRFFKVFKMGWKKARKLTNAYLDEFKLAKIVLHVEPSIGSFARSLVTFARHGSFSILHSGCA